MSGSWVGKNHNIPQNKFNLLPDIHDRIGQMKFGQKGAPLQYTSLRIGFKTLLPLLLAVKMSSIATSFDRIILKTLLRSVISGSSASLDRRRDLHWIQDCKNFFNNNET